MEYLSQAFWQWAFEERKFKEQRLQKEQQLDMQRMQLEQQYEEQRRQREFEERSGDRSLFVPVPKPRTGIKSGIGKKETQPENVVIDRCRFVPVPKPRTSIQPGNGKRKTQPGNVVPEKYSARSASQYTDSQGQRPVPAP